MIKTKTPTPKRYFRFGQRVVVSEVGHFYEGLYAILIGAACYEPMYQLCLDLLPDQECWVSGDCLTILDKGDEG